MSHLLVTLARAHTYAAALTRRAVCTLALARAHTYSLALARYEAPAAEPTTPDTEPHGLACNAFGCFALGS